MKPLFGYSLLFVLGLMVSRYALSSEEEAMKINVIANGKTIVFLLNGSEAAKGLVALLPLETTVEDYAGKERIFYPPKKLEINHTPLADSTAGSLAYYAPWGDVVMFYEDFGQAPGLYELGHAVSGEEHIRGLSGTVFIEVQ